MIVIREERDGQLSNRELQKLSYDIFTKYTGIKVRPSDIVMLEADTDGKYLFFRVGKLTFAYMNRLGQDSLAAYPDDRGVDGMIIHSGLYGESVSVTKASKSGWSDKFASLLNNLGVSLTFEDGKFFIVDDEGTFSFDDVDGFTSADEIVDRLSGIIDDFILTDLEDEAEEYSIQFDGDIPNGWEEWDDWAKTTNDPDHKEFIKNHKWELEMMDLLCNHVDEIDLEQFK